MIIDGWPNFISRCQRGFFVNPFTWFSTSFHFQQPDPRIDEFQTINVAAPGASHEFRDRLFGPISIFRNISMTKPEMVYRYNIEHYTKNARYSSIRVQWKSRTGIPLQNYLMPSKIFAILQETNHRLVFDPPIRHFTRSQAIAIGNFYALHGSCTVEILHENFTKLQGNSRKDHIPLLPSLSCFCLFVNR